MIRRLYRIYRPHLGWLLLGVLLSLLTLLANVGLLALSGWFITAMAAAGLAGAGMNYFGPAAIIRGLAMARTAGRYGERVVTHEATFRLIADLRGWFYQRIEPLAPAALQGLRSGELLSRLQKDIDRLDAVYLRIALPILVAGLGVLLMVLFMALYSPRLALLNLAFLLAGGVILPLWIRRLSLAPAVRQVRLSSRLRTQAVDTVQGLAELIAFDADARQARAFEQTDQAWQQAQDALHRAQSPAEAGIGLLSRLALWGVLLLAIPLVRDARLDGPQLAMLALFTLAGFEALLPLPAAFGAMGETAEAARRLFGIADTPPPVREPARPRPPPQQGELRFEGVGLRYPGTERPALTDIDLCLPEGSITLLQGPSGAGKTSLADLLLRFRDPDRGCIRYAGIDLRAFDSEQWRRRVSLVSQHAPLIAGTLRENLRLADPEATDETLLAACRQAQLDGFVANLPEGLDTWLGETGTRLSGGQARRVAIARALLKPAPILILDEPTEGLDLETEARLVATLDPLLNNRTVLLISHRPLRLSRIDQVVRLREGRISG